MAHIRRFDHVGITVADLDAMTAFFVGLGLEVEGRTFVEGEFVDTVIGIPGSRSHIVVLRPPGGGPGLELSSFVSPDHEPGSPTAMANELGLRNVAFEVDDLQTAVDRLAADGYGLVGGIGQHENSWRMAYVRGPEGIIVSLAERIGAGAPITAERQPSQNATRLERTYDAPAGLIWELWTTAAGIEEWWAPDGFENQVSHLELRPGGELIYTMTATAPEQVEFMKNAGMPLTTDSRKTFTEVSPPTRLGYLSLIDFVPDHEPYEHLTIVEITSDGDRSHVVMTVDPMHDETWTQRIVAGRNNELDNLQTAIARRA